MDARFEPGERRFIRPSTYKAGKFFRYRWMHGRMYKANPDWIAEGESLRTIDSVLITFKIRELFPEALQVSEGL